MAHIFISYAHQDRALAQQIQQFLESIGLAVWIDYSNIPLGEDWEKKLEEGISQALAVLVVMTPASKESTYVRREQQFAEYMWKPIYPLLCEGEVWFRLLHLQYLDLRSNKTDGLEQLGSSLKALQQRKQAEERAGNTGEISYGALIDYLAGMYETPENPLLSHADIRYPAIVFVPTESQRENVNSCLDLTPPKNLEPRKELAFLNDDHLNSLRQAGRRVEDNPTFTFSTLTRYPLQISANIGTYFDMIRTCDALEAEIRQFFTQMSGRSSHEQVTRSLSLRQKFHSAVSPQKMLLSGVGRSAMIGGSTLIVFNHSGVYKTILVQRSSSTAVEPNFYQPVPSFVFQPRPNISESFYPLEWDFQHQIFREYLEELFGFEEQTKESAPVAHDYFYDHPALRYLRDLIARGQAGLYLTGICMNLLTLRPEICSLLMIYDPAWYDRVSRRQHWDREDVEMLKIGWEADSRKVVSLRIENDDLLQQDLPQNFVTHITPQGAAAFWLGVEYAREMLNKRSV